MPTACLLLVLGSIACSPAEPELPADPGVPASPPNILLLVADDLGYSDLGFLGSEIRTPNLDQLAAAGSVLTNYHVSPACSPTRAMLLAGTDPHPAGLGTMAGEVGGNQIGKPGYEGVLSDRVVTVARLLRDNGYLTAISGKWHLGADDVNRPENRGFERSFVLLPGGASHFSDRRRLGRDETPAPYLEDGADVELPEDFYSSDFFTDKLIEYVSQAHGEARPFFALAAFTAPHWPLQAKDDEIDGYRGVYDAGWDELRRRRLAGLRAAGVVPLAGSSEDTGVAADGDEIPAWESLTEARRRIEAREMELYAAMVENLDRNIGRLLAHLADTGQLDNTLVMFSSDNGAEGNPVLETDWVWEGYDNSYENLGRPGSYVVYHTGWARASTAPFRLFKTFPTEGGTRVPAIVRLPGGIRGPAFDDVLVSVLDVAPTVLELAGVEHPGTSYAGRTVAPLEGASMVPFLRGESPSVHPPDHTIAWELFGRRALLRGDWKLLWLWEPYGAERWSLYNLASDPSESVDLAEQEPAIFTELVGLWSDYAERNGVVLPTTDTSYARLPDRR